MEQVLSILLAFLQLVVGLYITYFEYKKRSCGVYLWAMMIVIFCLTHFLTVIQYSSASRYPLWVYDAASLFALFFNIIYLITRVLITKKESPVNTRQIAQDRAMLSPYQERLIKWMFWIMCGSAFIRIYHLAKYSGGLLSTSWGDMLNSGGGYFGVEQIFRIIFYCTASVIYPALYFKKKKLAIASILLVLFVTIITRNRADILPLLISVIAYILNITKKIDLRLLVRISLLGAASVILIYTILLFRFYGSINNFIDNVDIVVLAEDVNSSLHQSDEGDLSVKEAFYFFIDKDNKFPGFNEMHTYIRMALFFQPTQWSFGMKPDDFAETMGYAWAPSEGRGFSMHPTLYGDCFANMYYFGVLLAIFWAIFVHLIDLILSHKQPVYRMSGVVIVGCAFIMIGRGSVYNPFVSIIYELLILYAISSVCRMTNKKKRTVSYKPQINDVQSSRIYCKQKK